MEDQDSFHRPVAWKPEVRQSLASTHTLSWIIHIFVYVYVFFLSWRFKAVGFSRKQVAVVKMARSQVETGIGSSLALVDQQLTNLEPLVDFWWTVHQYW